MSLRLRPQQSEAGLRALILDRARQAARRFSPAVARELLEEAESHICRRIWACKLDPQRQEFPAAVGRALFHLGVDLYRQQACRPAPLTADHLVPFIPGDPDEDSPASRKLGQVRHLLDAIRWGPATPGSIDLFAILLLHLRLSLAAAFGRAQALHRDQPLAHMADFVAWCLPWGAEEECLPIAPGLPRLAQAWAALRAEIDVPPYRVATASVCRALSASLKTSRWDQWVCRARREARDRLGPETWDDLFARWLPEKRPAQGRGRARCFLAPTAVTSKCEE